MSYEKFDPKVEKPMTSDEANMRMQEMMRERARQDAEFRQKYPPPGPTGGATGPEQYSGATGPSRFFNQPISPQEDINTLYRQKQEERFRDEEMARHIQRSTHNSSHKK